MSTDHIYLKDIHKDHKEWLNALQLNREEIESFENRLEEVVTKNNKTEVRSQVEHFQNQFIRHREVLDQLVHDINKHEHELARYAEENPVAIDHKYFPDHPELRESVQSQAKIFGQLSDELNSFLAKWM